MNALNAFIHGNPLFKALGDQEQARMISWIHGVLRGNVVWANLGSKTNRREIMIGYEIKVISEHEFLPIVKVDGREIYRGEYQKTSLLALAKCEDFVEHHQINENYNESWKEA